MREKNAKDWSARQTMEVIVGIFISIAAVVSWHNFHVDGFLAFIAAGFGFSIIAHAFGTEFDWF